jgi:hypothetical protein
MDAPRPIGCQKWPSRSYCMYHTHVNRHQLHLMVLRFPFYLLVFSRYELMRWSEASAASCVVGRTFLVCLRFVAASHSPLP